MSDQSLLWGAFNATDRSMKCFCPIETEICDNMLYVGLLGVEELDVVVDRCRLELQ